MPSSCSNWKIRVFLEPTYIFLKHYLDRTNFLDIGIYFSYSLYISIYSYVGLLISVEHDCGRLGWLATWGNPILAAPSLPPVPTCPFAPLTGPSLPQAHMTAGDVKLAVPASVSRSPPLARSQPCVGVVSGEQGPSLLPETSLSPSSLPP